MTRRPFEPTDLHRNLVSAMTAFGATQQQICAIIEGPEGGPIDQKTLVKYFRKELDRALPEMIAKVANSLYEAATKQKGSHAVAAAQFILERRGGNAWRRPVEYVLVREDIERTIRRMKAEIATKGNGLAITVEQHHQPGNGIDREFGD